jgi:tRNA(fMet)-specific endonuclease VapC
MPAYMLDTDICSYVMKRSSRDVLERLASVAVQDVCMSVVTKAELMYGVEVSPHPARDTEALGGLLVYVRVVDFPDAAAHHYADIRADLKRRGAMIGANDLLIAAHARSLEVTLVTNNADELSCVRGLQLENWAA